MTAGLRAPQAAFAQNEATTLATAGLSIMFCFRVVAPVRVTTHGNCGFMADPVRRALCRHDGISLLIDYPCM